MTQLPLEIRNLPIDERLILVTALWDSIAQDETSLTLTEEQQTELNRRLEARASREPSGTPWPEVKRRILGK
jgi:putative addiction module component (TIGR02574 family)